MSPAKPVIQLMRLNAPRASFHTIVNQFRRTFALNNHLSSSSSSPQHCRALSTTASIHITCKPQSNSWLNRRPYSNTSKYVLLLPLNYYLTRYEFSIEEQPPATAAETAAPLLSKLFPQTAPEADNGAKQERKKREEDEAKENERAWKRMKLGYGTVC